MNHVCKIRFTNPKTKTACWGTPSKAASRHTCATCTKSMHHYHKMTSQVRSISTNLHTAAKPAKPPYFYHICTSRLPLRLQEHTVTTELFRYRWGGHTNVLFVHYYARKFTINFHSAALLLKYKHRAGESATGSTHCPHTCDNLSGHARTCLGPAQTIRRSDETTPQQCRWCNCQPTTGS